MTVRAASVASELRSLDVSVFRSMVAFRAAFARRRGFVPSGLMLETAPQPIGNRRGQAASLVYQYHCYSSSAFSLVRIVGRSKGTLRRLVRCLRRAGYETVWSLADEIALRRWLLDAKSHARELSLLAALAAGDLAALPARAPLPQPGPTRSRDWMALLDGARSAGLRWASGMFRMSKQRAVGLRGFVLDVGLATMPSLGTRRSLVSSVRVAHESDARATLPSAIVNRVNAALASAGYATTDDGVFALKKIGNVRAGIRECHAVFRRVQRELAVRIERAQPSRRCEPPPPSRPRPRRPSRTLPMGATA